jgi:transcriptional regulator with XRE-family HTH domain
MTTHDTGGLGARIREARDAAGLTQRQLADRLGTVQHVVSGWETGARAPNVANLASLATALDVTTDWLLGR